MDELWGFDNTYNSLPSAFFSAVLPTEVSDPELYLFNSELAAALGLGFLNDDKAYTVEVLSGNIVPKSTTAIAQAYGGHQFGYFNVLGDGRAILLGEIKNASNERFDIQLKGAGRTPYSRRGDGRATLYSMLREYLISEAMHALGIKTTRSLAVVSSDDPVRREVLHDAGVLTRIASSHIRVGTFELVARMGNRQYLKDLLNYTVNRHTPQIAGADNVPLEFLKIIVNQQIDLVTDWMRVGFIHGVMNTDNMSIAGETIDYGPCAFMNAFDPQTVFSSIDEHGRYAYANQPKMAMWNLMRLAETLLPLIDDDAEKAVAKAQPIFDDFEANFQKVWLRKHLLKLGIQESENEQTATEDEALLNELMMWLEHEKADFTNTFAGLWQTNLHENPVFQTTNFKTWKAKWLNRTKDVKEVERLLKTNNPAVIPRNHLVENVLKAASNGDNKGFSKLLKVLQNPFHVPSDPTFQEIPLSEDDYKTFCGT